MQFTFLSITLGGCIPIPMFLFGIFFFFFTDYIYTNKFVLFLSRKFCMKWVLLNLTTIFESKVTFEYFQNENIPNDDEILHC